MLAHVAVASYVVGEYDYNSLMHYAPFDFARSHNLEEPVLRLKEGVYVRLLNRFQYFPLVFLLCRFYTAIQIFTLICDELMKTLRYGRLKFRCIYYFEILRLVVHSLF